MLHIQSGKPMQNGHIESFNGRFRDECLNANWFTRMSQARALIEQWRRDYNERRPHSSLGYCTPEEFARARHIAGFDSAEQGQGAQTPPFPLHPHPRWEGVGGVGEL